MNQNPNDKVLNFKVQNDTSYYFDMLQRIASASKYTAETHGWTVLEQLRNALFEIMCYGNYRWFTREYEIREKMQKYTPDDYFNFMYDFIKMQNPDYLAKYVKNNKDKYYVSNSNLIKIINDFCNTILEPLIRNCKANLSLFPEYNKINKIQPQNVVYNSPSNECCKAVISDTQTIVSNSSFCGYGMYAYSVTGKEKRDQKDSYQIGVHPWNPDFKLMVVADGVDNFAAVNVASEIAVRELMMWFENLPPQEFYNDNNDIKRSIVKKIIYD